MKYLPLALLLLVFAWYLSFLATRLDRLHHRVETSWAHLDGLLQRRAAVALEIAHGESSDPALALLLMQTAHQAREASMRERSDAESALTAALGLLMEDEKETRTRNSLLLELGEITEKIRVAISIHIEAVDRTHLVRRKLFIRLFRLAGRAPLPVRYEFEADAI